MPTAIENARQPSGRPSIAVVSYADFRTGLTYREVYQMIWSRKWKRRHGVLGKWYEIKRAMYLAYLEDCLDAAERAQR